jgi:hypothetical protein
MARPKLRGAPPGLLRPTGLLAARTLRFLSHARALPAPAGVSLPDPASVPRVLCR